MAIKKKRNWAFVLYPESAPTDWIEQLQQTGLSIAISPLHDKDVNPDGEVKKAHYHIILCYSGPTSFNVVKNITDKLNQPIPQPLEQIKGYYRYFTHKDNPEKYPYDESDIKCLNGFSIYDFIEINRSEVLKIKSTLQELILEKNIYEYFDFCNFVKENRSLEEYDVATSHTLFFNTYLKSRRHKNTK